jgi:hypothetical protein
LPQTFGKWTRKTARLTFEGEKMRGKQYVPEFFGKTERLINTPRVTAR